MPYTKHNYQKGDELLASQLNDMDDQIALNEQTADILVTVSNTQPPEEKNRVWVKATPSEIEIPTMEDVDELKTALNSLYFPLKIKYTLYNASDTYRYFDTSSLRYAISNSKKYISTRYVNPILSDVVAVDFPTATLSSDIKYRVSIFDETGSATTSGSTGYITSTGYMTGKYVFPSSAKKFLLSFYKESAEITSAELTEIQNAVILYTKESATFSIVTDEVVGGGMTLDNLSDSISYSGYTAYRKTSKLIEVGTAPILIQCNKDDVASISTLYTLEYTVSNGEVVKLASTSGLAFDSNGQYLYTPTSGAKYLKLALALVSASTQQIKPITFYSKDTLSVVKNPPIYSATLNNIGFTYKVSGDTYTSGQLMLPPDYTVNGKPVPLYVAIHGTGGIDTWDRQMGNYSNGFNDRTLLEYMANEGFAVFDCYPWTSKYYSSSQQDGPFVLSVNQKAYIEGIKFVCKNYNVDISNVCISGYSLGGSLAYWFMNQTEIPVKAVALLAPSFAFANLVFMNYFTSTSGRTMIVNALGLQNETEASTFISTVKGISDSTCSQFVADHLEDFAGMIPSLLNVSGTTYQNMYDWSITGTTTLPEWMSNIDIPKWTNAWESGGSTGAPIIIQHPDLSKYSPCAVKYWCAFDDENVSTHANFTIYQWLKNGGTKAFWRTMPQGTGGHYSMTIHEDAITQNGTTRLGVAYSNINVATVEMADFFYDNIAQ